MSAEGSPDKLAADQQRRVITSVAATVASTLVACGGDMTAAQQHFESTQQQVAEQLMKLKGSTAAPTAEEMGTAAQLVQTLMGSLQYTAQQPPTSPYITKNPGAEQVPTIPLASRTTHGPSSAQGVPRLWSSLISCEELSELPFVGTAVGRSLELEIVSLVDHRLDYDAVTALMLPGKAPLPLLIRFHGFSADRDEAKGTFTVGRCLTLREPFLSVSPLGDRHIVVDGFRDVQWHSRRIAAESEDLKLASKALTNIALCRKKQGEWLMCLQAALAAALIDDGNRKAYFFAATAIAALATSSSSSSSELPWEGSEAALWVNWLYALSEYRAAAGPERSAWVQEEKANWGPLLDEVDAGLPSKKTANANGIPFLSQMGALSKTLGGSVRVLSSEITATKSDVESAERHHSEGNDSFRSNELDAAISSFSAAASARLTCGFAETALKKAQAQAGNKVMAFAGAFATLGLAALGLADESTAAGLLSRATASMGFGAGDGAIGDKLTCGPSSVAGRGLFTKAAINSGEKVVASLQALTPPTCRALFDAAGMLFRAKPLHETCFSPDLLTNVTEQEEQVAYISRRCVLDPLFALQVNALAPEESMTSKDLHGSSSASLVSIDSAGRAWHSGISSSGKCILRSFVSGNLATVRSIFKANGFDSALESEADREKALTRLSPQDKAAIQRVATDVGTQTPLVGQGVWVTPALMNHSHERCNVRYDIGFAAGSGPTRLEMTVTALRDIEAGEELFDTYFGEDEAADPATAERRQGIA